MRIAFVGCGYVSDFYMTTLNNYPQLVLAGVFDKNEERATRFAQKYAVKQYSSLDELLTDQSICIVVNLTNIGEHYSVTRACLEAGKHVYSEKPLALNFAEARELVELSIERSLQISCAPANILGEAAQTVWKQLQKGAIGKVWLVYAELDDGAVHLNNYHNWRNSSGVPWPFQDEFEMGCTLEHAAYHLGCLTMFFGPAKQVSTFASCLVPDKIAIDPTTALGDDISISCITFTSGVVARLTCSTLAPKNHSLTMIGNEGILAIEDCWQFMSPVYIQKRLVYIQNSLQYPYTSKKTLVQLDKSEQEHATHKYNKTRHEMDFSRGIAELSDALQQNRIPRLSAQHALHISEIISCIVKPPALPYVMTTTFPEIMPMPWIKE